MKWLGDDPATEQELWRCSGRVPGETLKIWPVDNKVGNVRNTGLLLVRPLEPEQERLI